MEAVGKRRLDDKIRMDKFSNVAWRVDEEGSITAPTING